MKYFKYFSSRSSKDTIGIYEQVLNLRYLIRSMIRSNWSASEDDIIDKSFEHVLRHYDSSKGELDKYAKKVVCSICKDYGKECLDDEKLNNKLNNLSVNDYICATYDDYEELRSSSVDSCIKDMVVLFVKDYKFFKTVERKYRKMVYTDIVNKYSYESIKQATEYLKSRYSEKVEKFISFSKKPTIRNFESDRYIKSIDSSLEYMGVLNDIILIKRKSGSHLKKIYKCSIEEILNTLIRLFYEDAGYGKIEIEGVSLYLTLSGKIIDDVSVLKSSLEKELVGSVLSRTSLKVLKYTKGKEILLSSTKDTQCDIILQLFGKNVSINFERVVVKEV